MELYKYVLTSFSTIAITVLTILLICKILRRGTRRANLLPPGPPRLPFIGNIHQLAIGIPHRRLHQLAEKYGPLMHLQLGQISTVVVSSSEAAKEVMKTHDAVFASRPILLLGQILFYNCTDIALSPYGDYWRKMRTICMLELLSAKRVQSFKRIREEVVMNSIESIRQKSGSTINFSQLIFKITNSIVAQTALGIKGNDVDAVSEIIGATMKVSSESGAADMFPSSKLMELITGIKRTMEKMSKKSDKLLEDVINDHRAKKDVRKSKGEIRALDDEEDLVDVLLKFEDDSNSELSLTTNNIKAVLLDMWLAGIDTTTATIEWAMSEMLKNPRTLRKAQDEVRQAFLGKSTVDESDFHKLEYLKLVIKETLRLHPSLPLLLPRESLEHRQIFGYNIPAKTRVMVNAWAIGRDPTIWPSPESFEPERFLDKSMDYKGNNFELIPFGAGRRMCPGMSYGLAVVEIQLAMFLYHFDWKLPDGLSFEDLDMIDSFGITSRREHKLHVVPTPYLSSTISKV